MNRAFVYHGLAAIAVTAGQQPIHAAGIYGDGGGARAMALGSADVAWAQGPLAAFGNNPAGLTELHGQFLEIGGVGVIPQGHFRNADGNSSSLRTSFGGWPEIAFGLRPDDCPARLFIGIAPEAALASEWRYIDPPGGADGNTSYGLQRHESEITVLRTGIGGSIDLTPQISFGASVGAVYNENRLRAPYTFQTQPVLAGVKTLLDLQTSGWGWNAQFGLLLRPRQDLQFGLTYKTRTVVNSSGDASGNAGVQLGNIGLGAARPDFHYDANVINAFPQMVSAGLSWQAQPKVRLAAQLDWIDWSGAFDNLHVKLKNGNNADLNGVVGSDRMEDFVPLNWKDQLVIRLGGEFAVTESIQVRGGYNYGRSPVPNGTLTPLTAVIMEHALTAGAGWQNGPWHVDFAYQWSLPNTQRVGTSELRSGEYSSSANRIGVHWFGLTTGLQF